MSEPPVDPPPPGQQPWPGNPPPPEQSTPQYPPQYPAPYPAQPPPPWGQQNLAPVYGEPPKQGTNGFAIAALVCGIIPICFLGIIFGIVALVQTSKSGQKGKGLAIAGLVLNVLWIIGIVTALVIGGLNNADRDASGAITKSGKISVYNLKVGDCFNGLDNIKQGDTLFSLDGVPCSKLHQGEVFANAPISGSSYPGRAELQGNGLAPCRDKLKEVAPEHFANRDVGVIWIYPEKRAWLTGDRHYSCIALGVGRTTGSITD